MNNVLTIITLSITVLFSTPKLYAELPPPKTSVTTVSTYQKGQIIAYFDEEGNLVDQPSQAHYYRKYLSKTTEGYYLIQDFYQGSNKKQCDPEMFQSENDFKLWTLKTSEGKHLSWYENGQKKAEGLSKNGKAEGLWIFWHENGQKEQEGHHTNGEPQGLWTLWYKNGQKEKEIRYKNGKEEGRYTFWHENGQMGARGIFKKGENEGLWTYWDDDGEKSLEGYFKNGNPIGRWYEWDGYGVRHSRTSDEIKEKHGW